MAKPRERKPEAEKLKAVRGFRLTNQDAAVWDDKVARSGVSGSEFFRLAVMQNRTQVIGDSRGSRTSKPHPMSREIIRLLAKESNNVNQIAHALNTANLKGNISDTAYEAALRDLEILVEQSARIREVI